MKVFFWAADRHGCGYCRGIVPMIELANHGLATWFDTAMPGTVREGQADVIAA